MVFIKRMNFLDWIVHRRKSVHFFTRNEIKHGELAIGAANNDQFAILAESGSERLEGELAMLTGHLPVRSRIEAHHRIRARSNNPFSIRADRHGRESIEVGAKGSLHLRRSRDVPDNS